MLTVIRNEPVAKYTSFKIGGPADYFVRVKNTNGLTEALMTAKKLNVPVFIMGSGTNLLVSDSGFAGMVIKIEFDTISLVSYKGTVNKSEKSRQTVCLEAGAGVLVNRLVRYTLDQGFSGLENFLGLPGTVGGAVCLNAHNMKVHDFVGNHIVQAKLIDTKGVMRNVPQSYFKFDYDESIVQESGDILLSVIFVLFQERDKEKFWERANEAVLYRNKTQPYGMGSAGCIFRNIDKTEAKRIGTANTTCSAGYLIDLCGLKGKRVGNAMISDKHANFIVNCGGATAHDVIQLIHLAKNTVKKKFGVDLKEEIVRVGDFS